MDRKKNHVSDACHVDHGGTRCRMIAHRRPSERQGRALAVAVSVRQQTPEEERRFHAALHLFLSEIVRQQLGRQGNDNG